MRPSFVILAAALTVSGCVLPAVHDTSPPNAVSPPVTVVAHDLGVSTPDGFAALLNESMAEIRMMAPRLASSSPWKIVENEGDVSLQQARIRSDRGTAILSLAALAEARTSYAAAAVTGNVTVENVSNYADERDLHERFPASIDRIGALREGGRSATSLVYLQLAEKYVAEGQEFLGDFDAGHAKFDQDRSLANAQDLVLEYSRVDSALWIVSKLLDEATAHPGDGVIRDSCGGLTNEALAASAALPDHAARGGLSEYTLAHVRFPAWINFTASHGWVEGTCALSQELLMRARAAARFEAGETGSTLENATRALSGYAATVRTPLDDWDAERTWDAVQRGASDPGAYIEVEEEAAIAEQRMNANAALLLPGSS